MLTGILLISLVIFIAVVSYKRPKFEERVIKNIPLAIHSVAFPKLGKRHSGKVRDWYIRNNLRDNIGKFLYSKTRRRPMILPVIVEI